jgi:fatty acid synthase subunit alpha, fungi type
MIKKTLATKYKVHDAAVSMKRDLLSYKRDARKLCYDFDPIDLSNNQARSPSSLLPAEKKKILTENAPVQNVEKDAASMALTTSEAPRQAKKTAAIPDTPISALEIVVAIIAPKLKKSFSEISKVKTIKQLAGG